MRSPASPHAERGHGIVLLAALLLQAVLVGIGFPVTELFSATPLLHVDAAHHWYQITLAADLAGQSRLSGYDPTFAAGYLGGIPYNTSARLPAALAAALSPWISAAVAFKLFSVGCALLGPLAVPAAARALGLPPRVAAVSALLAIILWWASPVHWYHTAGVVAWPFAVFAALWFAASVVAFARGDGGAARFVLLLAAGAGLFLTHPLFPIAAAIAIIPMLAVSLRTLQVGRLWAWLVVLPLGCVAANLPWILATVRNPGMADGMQPYQQAVDIHMVWQDMLGLPSAGRGSRWYGVLVFLAAWGVAASWLPDRRKLCIALALAAVATLVFAAVGSASAPLAVIQTNRFGIQAYVMLLIPAAVGLLHMARQAVRGRGVVRIAAVPSLAIALLATAFFANEVRRELTPGRQAYYGSEPPEVRAVGPASQWALQQLRTHTDAGARVMFELSHARVHDGAHMAGYLARESGREFIGGAYPYTHFANFWDNWAFGQPLDGMPVEKFREYLGLYNVGWLLVHSPGARAYIAQLPELSLLAQAHGLALYRVDAPHSYFVEGSGNVVGRSANRLELANLSGETVILKYHYVPGMRSEPAARVDGVVLPGDPQPFVRIRRPAAAVVLSMP